MTYTFEQVQNQIQRDLAKNDVLVDTDAILTEGTIAYYIKEAIRFYSKRRLGFNEEIATLTADGTNEIAVPEDFGKDIELTDDDTGLPLTKKTLSYILNNRLSYEGSIVQPEFFTIFRRKFRFSGEITSGKTFTLSYVKVLPELMAAGSSNEWLNEGNALIRAKAMGDIFLFKRRDQQSADAMYAIAQMQYENLVGDQMESESSGSLEVGYV